jgi:ribonuclease HII
MIHVGIDEAGRGSYISRVYAASVIVNDNFLEEATQEGIIIRDSKKMTEAQRLRAKQFIETNALDYAIGYAERDEIDTLNILQATMLAMHRALDQLSCPFDCIDVDGEYFKSYHNISHQCIVKGDTKNVAIAAASILAKTYRDEFIIELVAKNKELEKYGILTNKGYGTKEHREVITQYGVTDFHRKSFHI